MTARQASLDPQQAQRLMDAARLAAKNAYAPYSRFCVGAALLADSDKTYTGANVENVSYGLTICAERAAVAKAVSDGDRRFQAIAVWADKMPNGSVTPCGACRQVLAEFMRPDAVILVAGEQPGTIRQITMATLLPESFGPSLARDESFPHTGNSKLPD